MKNTANHKLIEQIKTSKPLKGFDFVVIGTIIIAILIAVFFINVYPDNRVVVAEIYSDNKLIKTVNLEISLIFDVEINGHYNTIAVGNGKIAVTHSDCGDKVCLKFGQIDKNNERIVCLPNKLLIKIIGEGDIDIIA